MRPKKKLPPLTVVKSLSLKSSKKLSESPNKSKPEGRKSEIVMEAMRKSPFFVAVGLVEEEVG
jgi:hypothetical protein